MWVLQFVYWDLCYLSERWHDSSWSSSRWLGTFYPPLSTFKGLVRIRTGLLGTDRAAGHWPCRWALKVTRGSRGGTRCIQVSSNWGTPSRNLRFIYKTKSKQGTNERNLVEGLRKESAECLSKGTLVLQSLCRGNRKELSYLLNQPERLPIRAPSTGLHPSPPGWD